MKTTPRISVIVKDCSALRSVQSCKARSYTALAFRLAAILVILGWIVSAGTAWADNATWLGGSGNWNDPTQWNSTTGVDFPNNGNSGQNWNAMVASGTDNLDVNITIQNFALSGGMVTGTSNLTVNQVFDWTGGELGTSGTLNANGGIMLDTSAGGYLELSQGTLNNASGQTTTFTGASVSYLDLDNGAVFNNNGAFLAQNNQSISDIIGGGGVFNNTGIFTRNTGSGTFAIGNGITFNNTGTVNVQTGTLDLQAGDNGNTTGAFVVSSGAVLQFDGDFTLAPASTISGTGTVNFSSGDDTLGGNSSLIGTTNFNGATLTSTGNATFTGPISWTAGTLEGTGTFSANGGITINASNSGNVELYGATLLNAAGKTATFVGTGDLYMTGGATLINSGTFLAQNSQNIVDPFGAGDTFQNNGVFTRNAGAGTLTIGAGITFNNAGRFNQQIGTVDMDSAAFTNTGTVNVQGGTLDLLGGDNGNTTGSFVVSSYAVLQFDGGYTLAPTSTISGTGTVNFSSGSDTLSGNSSLIGTTNFNGATLTATGTPTFAGPISWTAGTLEGTGTFSGNGGITINAGNSGDVELSQATLSIAAGKTVTFEGTGDLYMTDGATLINSGTFLAQNSQTIWDPYSGGGTFQNNGVFTRNSGSGTFTIGNGVVFNNAGTMNVQVGTVSVQDGGAGTGSFVISSNAVLQFIGSYNLASPSSFSGTGQVDINNGILSGTSTFNSVLALSGPGTFGGGLLSFSTGKVTMDASNSGAQEFQLSQSTLTVAAGETATFVGTGGFDLGNGAMILNSGTFTAANGQTMNDNLAGGGTFQNNGVFVSNPGAQTFSVTGVGFNNAGSVSVKSGTLSLQGGGIGSGSFVAGSGAVLQIIGGYNLTAPSSFSGAGLVDFNNGTLSGTATFNSALTLSGSGTWSGGQLTFPTGGVTMDASNSGNGEFQLDGSRLTVSAGATATFIGTNGFDLGDGASIVNSGTFFAENDQYIDNGLGGGGTFQNNGTFTGNPGAAGTFSMENVTVANTGTFNAESGVLVVSGSAFNNSGSVSVQSGTLSLQGGGGATGGFAIASNATLQFIGNYNLASPSSFSGAGVLDFNNGTLSGTSTFDSVLTLSGSGTWSNGLLTFSTGGVTMDASNGANGEFQLNQSTLTVAASRTATFVGTGDFDLGGGATIINSGTFLAENGQTINDDLGGGGTFQNNGVFVNNPGAQTFTVNGVTFNNAGLVNVKSGTLSVQGGGAGSGGFTVASGAVLQIVGNYNLVSSSTFSGAGMLDFNNGSLSGTSTFNSALTLSGSGTWSGGQLTFPTGGVTMDSSNSGNGEFQLNGSTLAVLAGESTAFVGASGFDLGNGAVIVNSGTFEAENDQYLDNALGGVGTFQNKGVFASNPGAMGTFTVTGITFENSGTVNVQSGILDLQGADNGDTTGVFAVSSGGVLQFDGTYTLEAATPFSGAGTLNFSSGFVTMSGKSNLTGTANFNGGALVASGSPSFSGPISWTAGTVEGTGTLSANGGLSIDTTGSAGIELDEATLVNAAGKTAILTGTGGASYGYFDMSGGAALINSGTFLAESNTQIIEDNIGGGGVIDNSGVFTRGIGTGALYIGNGIGFNNTGKVNVQSGTLDLQGGDNGNTTGSFTVSPGGVLQFDGNYTLEAASSLTGGGTVNFSSNTVNISGSSNLTGTTNFNGGTVYLKVPNSSFAVVNVSGGTVGGTGNATFTGSLSWTGGTLGTSGTISANGGISIDVSGTSVELYGGTLVNSAGETAILSGAGSATYGYFDMSGGAVLINSGTFLAESNIDVVQDKIGGGGAFDNKGVFVRSTGTGTFDFASGITFSNPGTVNVQTGTLEIDGPITQLSGSTLTGGTWVVSNGATLYFNNGGSPITTNNGDVSLGGSNAIFTAINAIAVNTGAFRLLGGANFTAAGTLTNSGTLQLGGGAFTSTGLISNSGGELLGFGTINAPVQLNANMPVLVSTVGATLTMNGAISGTGGLITSGPGTLALAGSNTYSGGTTLTSGTVRLGNGAGLGAATGRLTVAAGTVDLHGFGPTVGALSGSSGALITTLASGTATLTVTGTANTLYAGSLNGGAGKLILTKSGGGTLTLTGSSNLSGGSLVSGSLGAIQISGGGAVSDGSGIAGYGGGSVTVTGSGSQWTNTGAVTIGDLGSGTLSILSGGSVSTGLRSYAGFSAGSVGAATVTGSGSKWTSTNIIDIGESGMGTLAISGGGSVSDISAYLGVNAGSTGVATVSGSGSVWANTNNLVAGYSGTSSVTISAGGAVSDGGGYIGANAGSAGTVTVSGSGSKWANTSNTYIGNSGTGTLAVSGGGAVSDFAGYIGVNAGSKGIATVSGTGSKWANTSNFVAGFLGAGTLTSSSGAVISDSNGYIGYGASSIGTVTISGSGSKWTNIVDLHIGDIGKGTLAINSGGGVSDFSNYLGAYAGSDGIATVSGSGSAWTNTNNFVVGYSGTGALTVSSGGSVSDGSGYIGYGTGSTGAVTVSGSGSAWRTSGGLALGDSGTGTLTITGGGLVSVTGATSIGSAGTLQLDGSSGFFAGSLTSAGGTLRTLGAVTFAQSATLGTGGMTVNSNGFNSTLSGVFSGAGGLVKSGSGTVTLTGSSTYTGATLVNAGGFALKTTSAGTASLGNTAITVATGATFYPILGSSPASTVVKAGTTGAGTAGAKLTLNPGSVLSMVDGAIGTFNLQQENSFAGAGLVIGGTSGAAPTLDFEIGNAGTGTDQIDVTKNASVLATGGKITIDALAGDTSLTAGNYNLITAAGGFSGTAGNGLSLSGTTITLDGTTYKLSLANSTTTQEVLTVSLAGTPGASVALEEPDSVAGSSGPVSDANENSAAGVENAAPAVTAPGISAPGEMTSPAFGTAAVPEPENCASGIGALVSLGLFVRRARRGKKLLR